MASLKFIIKAIALICSLSVITALGLMYTANIVSTYTDVSSNEERPSFKNFPTVIIDAGHGGEDGGTVGVSGVYEKDINLKISVALCDILRASGVEVILTRDRDILLYDPNSDYYGHKKVQDLAKRLEIARKNEDAIFVSIHQNSFSDSKYYGLQVYYSQNSPMSEKLAQNIQQYTQTYLQRENTRKIKPATKNIFLLEKITSPAVLVECGFLSNPHECELLGQDDYQKKLVSVIYAAIMDYFALLED